MHVEDCTGHEKCLVIKGKKQEKSPHQGRAKGENARLFQVYAVTYGFCGKHRHYKDVCLKKKRISDKLKAENAAGKGGGKSESKGRGKGKGKGNNGQEKDSGGRGVPPRRRSDPGPQPSGPAPKPEPKSDGGAKRERDENAMRPAKRKQLLIAAKQFEKQGAKVEQPSEF